MQEKICPTCGQRSSISAPQCAQCGHTFRTQFVPQDRTIAVPAHGFRPQPPSTAGAQQYALSEATRQYKTLVIWQMIGLGLLLAGPILAIFLVFTGLGAGLLVLGLLFPLLLVFTPIFAFGGLVYALIRKPALREKVAGLGIDPLAWSEPMERPIRYLWVGAGGFTLFLLVIATIMFNMSKISQSETRSMAEQEQRMQGFDNYSSGNLRPDPRGPQTNGYTYQTR